MKKNRKPRRGDWFTIRSPAGGVDLKVKSVRKHKDGGDNLWVTAKGSPYWYDVSAISEAAWVADPQAIEDRLERQALESRQQLARIREESEIRHICEKMEIEELLGVDPWGETKRPHKKIRGCVMIKTSAETHAEIIAAIKKLKAKK